MRKKASEYSQSLLNTFTSIETFIQNTGTRLGELQQKIVTQTAPITQTENQKPLSINPLNPTLPNLLK